MSATSDSMQLDFHWTWLVLAILCAAGAWTYVARVLIPYQVADAITHGRPRGNLSDLYPRWLGARELLLHGRDPYGPDVTREIQEGYYGHALDPARPTDPKDQQKFVYPVYVVFYLAPTVHQPFALVRQEATGIFLGLTIAMVLLWLPVLRWTPPLTLKLAIVILTLGSLPALQGLELQQMTLFVAALLALALWLLTVNRPVAAGVLLALATIKPQLVGILLLWLLLWTTADWRRRLRWIPSFVLTIGALFAFSEYYLRHWLPSFLQAVREYQSYSDAVSIIAKLVPAPWNVFPLALIGAATVFAAWKNRRCATTTPEFGGMAALVLAVTIVVIPTYALYNQILLLPALLWMARDLQALWQGGAARRGLTLLTCAFLIWPWVTSLVLALGSLFLPSGTVQRAWAVPFWTALLFPIAVAALVLVVPFSTPFAAHEEPVAS